MFYHQLAKSCRLVGTKTYIKQFNYFIGFHHWLNDKKKKIVIVVANIIISLSGQNSKVNENCTISYYLFYIFQK